MRFVNKAVRVIRDRIHRRHVGYEFPAQMLTKQRDSLPSLPEGYSVHQPLWDGDEPMVVDLLNREPGFGAWTGERVRRELLGRLAHPKSGTLVMYGGEPVAIGFATDESTRRRKIAHGMYLYIVPAHRGRTKLSSFIVFDTLGHCLDAGYDQVLGFTDPTRLSALLLYLSNGVRPIYGSLSCYWHWRKIYRRLGPALDRAARLRASAAARAVESEIALTPRLPS